MSRGVDNERHSFHGELIVNDKGAGMIAPVI
jgi:hypothetical protein